MGLRLSTRSYRFGDLIGLDSPNYNRISGSLAPRKSTLFAKLNYASLGMLVILTFHAFNSYLYKNDIVMAASFLVITIITIIAVIISAREN